MRVKSLSKVVLILIGVVMTLAPMLANASDSTFWARQRPAICHEVFKDYRLAVRKCRGYGIVRLFDGWNFVGYGCNCSAWDEQYFPQRQDNLLPGNWHLDF